MFDRNFIEKAKHFTIFALLFTLLFILFFKTIFFTLPFILAFIIALCTRPLMKLLTGKLKLGNSVAALISTLIVFSSVLVILTSLIYKIADEARQAITSIPNMDSIQEIVSRYTAKLGLIYRDIDPSITQKAQEQLSSVLGTTFDITAKALNSVVSFATSLPLFLLVVLVVLLSTYFFTKDTPNISEKIIGMFSRQHRPKVTEVLNEAGKMLGGYIKAYSKVMTLTFLQILIGFLILRVDYALLLSILCWILDLLPVLGIFMVFGPLMVIYAVSGKYFITIGLIVLWAIVTIVRQIVEPKIVSSSLDLHPLAVLAAIFIGITAYGFLGMIYILGMIVFYKILKKTGIL